MPLRAPAKEKTVAGPGFVSIVGTGIGGVIATSGGKSVTTHFRVMTATFTAISAGADDDCAMAGTGQLGCWGAGTKGQLGRGEIINQATPVPSARALRFTQLAAGAAHVVPASSPDRRTSAWGGQQPRSHRRRLHGDHRHRPTTGDSASSFRQHHWRPVLHVWRERREPGFLLGRQQHAATRHRCSGRGQLADARDIRHDVRADPGLVCATRAGSPLRRRLSAGAMSRWGRQGAGPRANQFRGATASARSPSVTRWCAGLTPAGVAVCWGDGQ